jgi:putative redox protein
LRFDFSGNGQSQGFFAESTFTKQIKEMQAAVAVLKARGATRIGLAGHSMGASISVLAGAETENVLAVCAIAGRLTGPEPERFLSAGQQAQFNEEGMATFTSRGRELTFTQSFVDDVNSFDLPTMLMNYPLPLLIIHGEQDEIIAVDAAQTAYQFNPQQIQLDVIADADHMFSQESHKNMAVAKITQWFLTHLT